MSQATVHQDPEPAGRPTLLYPTPLRDLIEVERERLNQWERKALELTEERSQLR